MERDDVATSRRRALVVAGLAFALVPTPAHARSVRSHDIGWPTALRRELRLPALPTHRCTARQTGAQIRRQDRTSDAHDPRDGLYAIFHRPGRGNLWGNLWYDPCDAGRLHAGVAPGPTAEVRRAVRTARAYLRRRHLAGEVRLIAVRSTYRQLSTAIDQLADRFDAQLTAGTIQLGVDTSRNAVAIDVARPATAADRRALRRAADASPVNVILHASDADSYLAHLDDAAS